MMHSPRSGGYPAFDESSSQHEDPANIYLRNYETSKDRCERAYRTNKANLLGRSYYDSKRLVKANGNFLRAKATIKEKHVPLKLADVDELNRIKLAIKEQGNASLRESFNMDLYERPVYKSVEKTKWKTARGMSYEGQSGNHVNTAR